MNRERSVTTSVIVIGACVAVLIFVAGWVASTVVADNTHAPVETVTVTVTPEPVPTPTATTVQPPTTAPVARPQPKPAPKHHHDDDDDSDGHSVKHEARKFNQDADGYEPNKGCDAECQFRIKNYGDD